MRLLAYLFEKLRSVMWPVLVCLGLSAFLALLIVRPIQAQTQPVARGVLLYSPTCPHCHDVIDNALPPIYDVYGDQLELAYLDVSDTANYPIYLLIAQTYPDLPNSVPLLIMDDTILVGSREIPEQLPQLIDGCLAKGGCDLPFENDTSSEAQTQSAAEPVYVAYFYDAGCLECDRVSADLSQLEAQYPNLVLRSYDIQEKADLCEAMCDEFGVPTSARLRTPAVFLGNSFLIQDDITLPALEQQISALSETGSSPPWENISEAQVNLAAERLVERFQNLGILAVLGAGLLDGVNPCAFTTMIFFVTYLTLVGRKGRDILLVGAAFTVAVFLTYIALGLGLSEVIRQLGDVAVIGRAVYLTTAIICLVLAAISLSDFVKVRQGDLKDIALQLPKFLKRRIHKTIRNRSQMSGFVGAAFVMGVLVSIFELACTGQVYLPTILFVTGIAELKSTAFVYLALYNLMFVLPLIAVFVFTYYGTSNQRLVAFFQKHAAAVKLLTAILFAVLGLWLLLLVLG